MLAPTVTLIALALSLAWAVVFRGGVSPTDWTPAVLFTGCVSFVYWLFVRRRDLSHPLPWALRLGLPALICYLGLQLIPLPLGLLNALDPGRGELASALATVIPGVSSAPISVNPPASVLWTFSILCYVAIFLLVRELSGRFEDWPWVPLLPVILIAGVEASVGIVQALTGGPTAEAHGTYANRDQFCGLLEPLWPFAAIYGVATLRKARREEEPTSWPLRVSIAAFAVALLLIAGVFYSQSKMALFITICVFVVVSALSFGPRLPSDAWRMGLLTALAVAGLGSFVFFPPDQILQRFADMSASAAVTGDTRTEIWRATLSLITDFRWFGCGLGGFESLFSRYQGVANGFHVEMANNDYLQLLAELGWLGGAILTLLALGIVVPMIRTMVKGQNETRRLLLTACTGALVAMALRSLVDFNLYVPANAMTLAWIAGIASFNARE